MKVEIISILDRSGSMADLRNDVIGGYNSFLAEQKMLPGKARMTLVQFNDKIEALYESLNVRHVGALTLASYIPLGSTALYDALGATLTRQGARIAREGWADKVIVTINTDGEENASREYTLEQVKALVRHYQDEQGWIILFQGANIDAFQTGATFGISAATTRSWTANAAGVAESYGAMTAYATQLRSGD